MAKASLWQQLRWTHQLWIRLPYSDRGFCIGRLPMYSGEPIGIWSGYVGPVVEIGRFHQKRTPMKEWAIAFTVPKLWIKIPPRYVPAPPPRDLRWVDTAPGIRVPSISPLDEDDDLIATWDKLHGQRPAE